MLRKCLSLLLSAALSLCLCTAFADSYEDMGAKAALYTEAEDYVRALACCQLAEKLRPDLEDAYLAEARIYLLTGEYASASAAIAMALERNPVSPSAWEAKCGIDALLCDVSALESDLIFAEVCGANLLSAYPAIASVYFSAGNYEKAAEFYALCDLSLLDGAQRDTYSKALILSGNRDRAEELGLSVAPARNAYLDSAFDHRVLMLEKTDLPAVKADAFVLPDELWAAMGTEKPEDPISEIEQALAEGTEVEWLSLSPAGNSGILVVGDTGVSYYNGEYRLIYPAYARGVEDVNGNLKKVSARLFSTLLGEQGVEYSPDGRYAAIFNGQYVLARGLYLFDPIIIDLSTGEMFLTETYGNQFNDENYGAVTVAAFSSDNQYLYYMLYGNTAEHRSALYRYCLKTGETELCYSGSDFNYYPRLAELGDGAFCVLRDARSANESAGFTVISREGTDWTGEEYSFDLPIMYWRCRRLLSSPNAGYTVITSDNLAMNDAGFAFQCVRVDENARGLNEYIYISKEDDQIHKMTAPELEALFEGWKSAPHEDGVTGIRLDMPFQAILTAVLSPDGHYLLLYTADFGTREAPETTRHLYLVRLDDLSMREVWGVDPADIQTGPASGYPPMIEWNTDALLIGTSDGVQAYRFQ